MVATLQNGLLAALTGLVAAAAACDRTPHGGLARAPRDAASDTRAQDAPASSPVVISPDRDAAATSRMRGIWCGRYLDAGKAPQGPLTVQFRPTSPTDFTYHIEFHCQRNCGPDDGPCDYSADIRAEHGSYQGALRGLKVQCSQSTVDGFAFDCGPLLNSSVVTVAKARSVTRTVHFEVMTAVVSESIPDQKRENPSGCLPFVVYARRGGHTDKSLNNNYFTFAPEQCRLDP